MIEYREARSLRWNSPVIVRRAMALPLRGQMPETVTIFPITATPSGRSYVAARGAAAYTGPASVNILTAPPIPGRCDELRGSKGDGV